MEPQKPEEDPFGETARDANPSRHVNAAAHELGLGDKLGRFEIVRQLGAGGMGIVYVALDPTLNRQVAVKLLKSVEERPLAAAAARARMLREAQAMARLSHPNVITVHEVGTVDDQVFIVMELNDGHTLGQWIKEPREWREVVALFIQAGLGLSAAHEAGLIHRDFKPDNILISRNGRVRVTDFGLVDSLKNPEKIRHDREAEPRASEGGMLAVALTHTGAMLGTPPYMAPEQHDAAAADARTDQFSFCVSLFEALYGYRPFQGSTYRALVVAILDDQRQERPDNSNVPAELHQILLRGLSSDRESRFASMKDLLTALRRFLAEDENTGARLLAASAQSPAATDSRFTALEQSSDSGFQPAPTRRGWVAGVGAFVAIAAVATFVVVRGQTTPALQDDSIDAAPPTAADLAGDASPGTSLVGTTTVPIDATAPAISVDASKLSTRPPRGDGWRDPPRGSGKSGSGKPGSGQSEDKPTPKSSTDSIPDKVRELTAAEKAANARAKELNLDLSGAKKP